MKKKLLLFAFAVILSLCFLSACGDNSSNSNNEQLPLTDAEIQQMYSSPKDFKGRTVTLIGKVFDTPEYDEDGVYFQMFTDIKNSENYTIVSYLILILN